MRRALTLGATTLSLALGLSGVVTAPAHAAPEGAAVSSFGHACSPNDVGPQPKCTYKTTSKQSFGGVGPFTITARSADGRVVYRFSCGSGRPCQKPSGVVPARKKVTVAVTGQGGSVAVGAVR
jgi:hypothetical protein